MMKTCADCDWFESGVSRCELKDIDVYEGDLVCEDFIEEDWS